MEYYKPKKNWLLKGEVPEKRKKSNKKYTLKYCIKCEKTWEIDCTKTTMRYGSLPTYGLKRKTCKYCKKENK